MPFPGSRNPYIVRVSSVTDGGSPVSGASLKLEDVTNVTDTTEVSSETNSNIAINLSECGDWAIGNEIKITATYDGKTGSNTHTTATGDNGYWSVGEIAITGDAFIPKIIIF